MAVFFWAGSCLSDFEKLNCSRILQSRGTEPTNPVAPTYNFKIIYANIVRVSFSSFFLWLHRWHSVTLNPNSILVYMEKKFNWLWSKWVQSDFPFFLKQLHAVSAILTRISVAKKYYIRNVNYFFYLHLPNTSSLHIFNLSHLLIVMRLYRCSQTIMLVPHPLFSSMLQKSWEGYLRFGRGGILDEQCLRWSD